MSSTVSPRRHYNSPRRRKQAGATRRAILDAAREGFVARGYVATTIEAIAAAASVSPETIYATFRTKRALLAALIDVSIAGDDEPKPLMERPWVQRLRDEPDTHRRVAILASAGRAILERRSAVDEVVRGAAAADAEIAALLPAGKADRHAGQRELLRLVAGADGLRPDLTLDEAADVLYALGSPETWRQLVDERAWSPERFERWYAEAIERLLLAPAGSFSARDPGAG